MKSDEDGFFVATLTNNDKCINCGKCKKVCDFNYPDSKRYNTPKRVFAAVTRRKDIHEASSSGGAFVSICETIPDLDVVYGCSFINKLEVAHVRVEYSENLQKLQKSKYVQSNTKNTFSECLNDLASGKTVLYSGTPCQIAGLKGFLGRDYENLITIGLVCHGVPSQKLFDNYITDLENKYKMSITEYSFRDRHVLLGDTEIGIRFGNGHISKHLGWAQDRFMNIYLRGLCYRKDCYSCIYANEDIRRPEDITIADCWNAKDIAPKLYSETGVSTVIFNTEKSLEVLKKLQNNMECYEISIVDFAKDNTNLVKPTKNSIERDQIYLRMNEGKSFSENVDLFVKRLGYPHVLKVIVNIIRKRR